MIKFFKKLGITAASIVLVLMLGLAIDMSITGQSINGISGQITNALSLISTAVQNIWGWITSPNINNVFYVDGFTTANYPGIGVTQTAWSSSTTYPACTAVTSSSVNYISVAQSGNLNITPGSNTAYWWPIPGANSSTQLECAYSIAASFGQANSTVTVIKLGTSTYSGTYNLNNGLLEPTSQYPVNIEGAGRGFNHSPTEIKATSAMQVMLSSPNQSGSLPYNFHVANVNFDGNGLANQCVQIYGQKVGTIEHVGCTNWVYTYSAASPFIIGDSSGTSMYQYHLDDIFVQSQANPQSSWGTGTIGLSGGVPSFTLSTAGSYVYIPNHAYIWGYGNGATPCTSIGTATPTYTGSGPYTLTGVTFSGYSGCSGTVYVTVPDMPAAPYGIEVSLVSDSTFKDLVINGAGWKYGIFYNGSASNIMIHEHVYGGSQTQILDGHSNVHFGAELDTITQVGVSSGSGQSLWIGTQLIQTPNPGTIAFAFGSNGGTIDQSTCQNTSTTSNIFSLASNSSGPIAHGGFAGTNVAVIQGQECDTLTYENSFQTALPDAPYNSATPFMVGYAQSTNTWIQLALSSNALTDYYSLSHVVKYSNLPVASMVPGATSGTPVIYLVYDCLTAACTAGSGTGIIGVLSDNGTAWSVLTTIGTTSNGSPSVANTTGTVTLGTGSTNHAGTLTSSTTGTILFTFTWGSSFAYPTRGVCHFTDETTSADSVHTTQATPPTPTTLTATGTVVNGDIISYSCSGF